MDIVANRPLGAIRGALGPTGTYVKVGGDPRRFLGQTLAILWHGLVGRQRFRLCAQNASREALVRLRDAVIAGDVRPVLDRVFTFDEAVAAFEHLECGHPHGRVIVQVG